MRILGFISIEDSHTFICTIKCSNRPLAAALSTIQLTISLTSLLQVRHFNIFYHRKALLFFTVRAKMCIPEIKEDKLYENDHTIKNNRQSAKAGCRGRQCALHTIPKYLGYPTCNYQIGDCTLERDGKLIIPECVADETATVLLEHLRAVRAGHGLTDARHAAAAAQSGLIARTQRGAYDSSSRLNGSPQRCMHALRRFAAADQQSSRPS